MDRGAWQATVHGVTVRHDSVTTCVCTHTERLILCPGYLYSVVLNFFCPLESHKNFKASRTALVTPGDCELTGLSIACFSETLKCPKKDEMVGWHHRLNGCEFG